MGAPGEAAQGRCGPEQAQDHRAYPVQSHPYAGMPLLWPFMTLLLILPGRKQPQNFTWRFLSPGLDVSDCH